MRGATRRMGGVLLGLACLALAMVVVEAVHTAGVTPSPVYFRPVGVSLASPVEFTLSVANTGSADSIRQALVTAPTGYDLAGISGPGAQPAAPTGWEIDAARSGTDAQGREVILYRTTGPTAVVPPGGSVVLPGRVIGFSGAAATNNGAGSWSVKTWDSNAASQTNPVEGDTFTSGTTTTADSEAPVTGFSAPTPTGLNGWNVSNVLLTLTATDNHGVREVRAVVGGGAPSVTAGSSASVPVSSEGTTIVQFNATDLVGNTETLRATAVKIDKTAPTLTFGSPTPAPNAAGWHNTDVSIAFTASDALSGLGSTTPASPLLLTTEGAGVTGIVTATDLAGNTAPFTSPAVNIDKTPPTITGSRSPAPNANGWNNGNVTASWTCSDALSGVDTVSGPVTITTEGVGQSATGACADLAGNSASATVGSISIDKTPPTLTFGSPTPSPNAAGWNNADVSVPFTASDALSGLASTTPASPLLLTTEGPGVTGIVTATDLAGNTATFTSPAVNIDKTPPTVSHLLSHGASGAGWVRNSVSVLLTASDAGSGVASVTYRVHAGGAVVTTATVASPAVSVALPEGLGVKVDYKAVDALGNVAPLAETPALHIDVTPPVVRVTLEPAPPSSGWYTEAPRVVLSASDAVSGVAEVVRRFVADGAVGPWVSGTGMFDVPQGNSVFLEYAASDGAGNPAGTRAAPRREGPFAIDNAPPVLTASSGSLGLVREVPRIEAAVSGGPSGLASVAYRVQRLGAAGGAPIAEGSFEPPILALPALAGGGSYEVLVSATDGAGNALTGATAATFTLDAAPPVVTLATPQVDAAARLVHVRGTVADDVGALSVDVSGGPGGPQAAGVGGDGSFAVAVPASPGTLRLRLVATDLAGRVSEPVEVAVALPEHAPPSEGGQALPSLVTVVRPDRERGIVTVGVSGATPGTEVAIHDPFPELLLDGVLAPDGARVLAGRSGGDVVFPADRDGEFRILYTRPAALPEIELSGAPEAGTTAREVALLFSTPGGVHVLYRVDGGAWTRGSALLLATTGVHRVEYRAVDGLGNEGPVRERAVSIDADPPAFGAIGIAGAVAAAGEPLGVVADVQDSSPTSVVARLLALNGLVVGEASLVAGTDGLYHGSLPATPVGAYLLQVVARDGAGNEFVASSLVDVPEPLEFASLPREDGGTPTETPAPAVLLILTAMTLGAAALVRPRRRA